LKMVQLIDDKDVAEVLIDPIRRTILTVLADEEMTESMLARHLGFTESAIGHHLRVLEREKLIRISKQVPENHGIIQKFYAAEAKAYIIDTRKLPIKISKYFQPVNIERVRSLLSIMRVERKTLLTDQTIEELALNLTNLIAESAEAYNDQDFDGDREEAYMRIYSKAFETFVLKYGRRLDMGGEIESGSKTESIKMKVREG